MESCGHNTFGLIIILIFCCYEVHCTISDSLLLDLSKKVIPKLESKRKGEAGKITFIGGSVEYTGAPYFGAITSLKVGADLVYVITTESASPIIKSYSPDLIVYPFLNRNNYHKIQNIINKSDVVVIGPGLGREDDTMNLTNNIIAVCKNSSKPLVIDADGLYAVSKNIMSIKDFPRPGVVLTPNHKEAARLKDAVPDNKSNWYKYWGKYVSVLVKDREDQFYSHNESLNWVYSENGSNRRAGGQGDILAGALGTFLNWGLKFNFTGEDADTQIAQSVAANAASRLTRKCNLQGYLLLGRSMTASDMLKEIHSAFESLFT